MKEFLKKKNVIFSAKRYGIDTLGAMAQGLFASLLIGTIISTLGEQLGIEILVTVGAYAKGATGAAMAVSIGYALQCPSLVLFSLAAVGMAANELGGAGGPLSVLVVTIFAAEFGKIVSKETKIDIIVTPLVTISVGVLLSLWWAPAIGAAASSVGGAIMWATELQPFFMGVLVSVIVGMALTLPISSGHLCSAFVDRACRRRCRGGMLCADGGICSDQLQGEPLGRPVCAGHRNLYAADGQYCPQSKNMAPAYAGLRRHRPHRYLCLSTEDERSRCFVRNGDLRVRGADRCVYRLDE